MKKKVLLIILSLFLLTSCTKKDSKIFKEDYENMNGVMNSNGKIHREVHIPSENPIVISDAAEIVKMIENEESFYVYFGSKLCPWCRSVIEKAIEVANNNGIEKVYYVDIWDDEGNEILRDKFNLDEENKPVKVEDGTEEYQKLLTYLDNVLVDYTYKQDNETLSFGEKRIYAPSFIYIAKGKAVRLTTGISEFQTDAREDLTKEMLEDTEKQFDDFFINICDENC